MNRTLRRGFTQTISIVAIASLTVLTVLFANPAKAADFSWNGAATGSFSDPIPWSPDGVPGSGDQAIFNRTDVLTSHTVTFSQPAVTSQLSMPRGTFNFDMGGQGYAAGATTIGGTAVSPLLPTKLTVKNGTLTATSLNITNTLSSATAIVNGSPYSYAAFLVVDGLGTGATVKSNSLNLSTTPQTIDPLISIFNGGKLETTGQAVLANRSNIQISGAGSTWNASSVTATGVGTAAKISLLNGAQMNVDTLGPGMGVSLSSSALHYNDSLNITKSFTLSHSTITGNNAQSLPVDLTVGASGSLSVILGSSVTASNMDVLGSLTIQSGSQPSLAAAVNSNVMLESGADMDVDGGAVNGALSLESGSFIHSNGLTAGSLAWKAGSTLEFSLDGATNSVLGALNLGTGAHTIQIPSFSPLQLGSGGYTFLTANGGITGFGTSQFLLQDSSGNPLGSPYFVSQVGNSLVLTVPVPEPASIVLVALGAIGSIAFLRKRRSC